MPITEHTSSICKYFKKMKQTKKKKTKEVIQISLVPKFSDHELAQNREFGPRDFQNNTV